MKQVAAYAVTCLLVLGLFTYGKYYGHSLFDSTAQGSGGDGQGSGGSSGFFYTGTSGGSHK